MYMMRETCRPFPPKPYEYTIWPVPSSTMRPKLLLRKAFVRFRLPLARQQPQQFHPANHQSSEFFRRRIRFDLPLQIRQLLCYRTVAQKSQAAFSVFPCAFRQGFKKDFKEQAAVFVIKRRSHGGGIQFFAGRYGRYQRLENVSRLQAAMQIARSDFVRQL